MKMDKLLSIVNRIFFTIAFIFLLTAIIEWFLGLFNWTLSFVDYQAGRLFEFSGIFLLFVITILLRQMRENLKSKSS